MIAFAPETEIENDSYNQQTRETMKKHLLFFLLFLQPLLCDNTAHAQELVIKNLIADASDISASVKRRMDGNNEPCALIKIQVVDKVVAVEGASLIGELQRIGSTTWVYVPNGTKKLTLLFEEHDPVTIQTTDYDINQLDRLSTYVLTLLDKAGIADPDNPTDAVAQYELAQDFNLGRNGRIHSSIIAATWFEKAANQGHDLAQVITGVIYMSRYQNLKEQSDFDKAIDWWTKAALQGLDIAQFNLAEAYVNCAEDNNAEEYYPKALKWAQMAAEQGHTRAMELAGDMLSQNDYLDLPGVPRDVAAGMAWYEKASEKGSSYASFQMGLLYQRGAYVKKDKKLARKWYEKSYAQGEKKALNRLNDPDLK